MAVSSTMAALINTKLSVYFTDRFIAKSGLRLCRYFAQDSRGVSVSEALKCESLIGTRVKIQGWIKAIRKQKDFTFLHLNDGESAGRIQVVVPSALRTAECGFNAAVEVSGELVRSPKENQPVEVQASQVRVLGKLDLDTFPFAPRKTYPPEYLRQYLHLRPKTSVQASILRLTSQISTVLHSTLTNDGFVQVYTPILTSNDCEGGGEVFLVKPYSPAVPSSTSTVRPNPEEAYFNKKVFLTVSGQLHLEAIAGGLSKVYTIGPTFRAENSRSRRHLAEFRMLEAELAFCDDLQPLLHAMEKLIKNSALFLLERGIPDVEILNKYYGTKIQDSLEGLAKKPFQTVSYDEAVEVLLQNRERFHTVPKRGDDFGAEHELFLVEHFGGPTFVVDWPSSIKPFYMREKDGNLVSCVDLLVPNVGELCGGSLREHRLDNLEKRLQALNLEESLRWYLDLRRYGGSPTGGFGMGLERLVAFLLQIPNIKDVVAFPRTPHNCQM